MTILKPLHYYLVGIGGISMSGIAFLLAQKGFRVSGSDITDSEIIEKLRKRGIQVNLSQKEENINSDIDFVVYSAAIPYNNPELKKARSLKIPLIKRSEIIGKLMKDKYGIAIAGMHGKTTTTSLITLLLDKAGLDPTALIGTEVKEIGGNFRYGKSDYFIAEACEYHNAFLDFKPKVAIITNIEAEHLDYFKNLNRILKSFSRFVSQLPPDGLLIICQDNKNNMKVISRAKCKVITYGFEPNADFVAFNVISKAGYIRFDIRYQNKILKGFELRIPGLHNVLNALATIALGLYLNIDIEVIKNTLINFRGASRRFELVEKINGITIISDYAHHPTEIKNTLLGASTFYPQSRIICVFQPHQYKRTKSLLKDFGASFEKADIVIIPNIYRVSGRDSEKDIRTMPPEKLVKEIQKNKTRAIFGDGFYNTKKYLLRILKPGDILIIMGAGDINKIIPLIIDGIKNKIKLESLIKGNNFTFKKDIKLNKFTTFKIGGPASLFLEVKTIKELEKVILKSLNLKIPFLILGSGSNVLISDYGFDGLVIKNNCQKIEIKNNLIIAESGALLSKIVQKALQNSLSGLEFAYGIPGTIGGAIVGNAGWSNKFIGDILTRALIIDKEGSVKTVNNDYFQFKYRYSKLKKKDNKEVILKVELQLKWDDKKLIQKRMDQVLKERLDKQPSNGYSAGCIFKNPSGKLKAGELIEKSGLKGSRVGEAVVSKKHANFIINTCKASATDVVTLIKKIKNKVKDKYNINLKEEIQYIGPFND